MNEAAAARRPAWVRVLLLVLAAFVFFVLLGLGTWQLQRLAWKNNLIEAVESRAYAPPVAPPCGAVTAAQHAYQRVRLQGRFLHDHTRRVKALTELGPGHWLMTPLQTADGPVWINRGFVPNGLDPAQWRQPAGEQVVEGLLRISEPGGTLLEDNDPAADRWVSRDVAALSEDAGLTGAAGWFVDADHAGAAGNWPRGGLTVLKFRNAHLSYAVTWYAMAVSLVLGVGFVVRAEGEKK